MAEPFLETARLRLRLFTPEDAAVLGDIDAAACGRRDRGPAAPSPDEAQTRGRHLVHRFLEQWDAYGFGVWAVVDKAHDTLLGYCGLQYVPGTAEVELLYLLDPAVWGRGVATEAAEASVRYGRAVVGLRRLVARVAASNRASRRVLEKVGLVCERVSTDGAQDIACYATPAGHLVDPAGETHPVDGGRGVHHGGVGEMRASLKVGHRTAVAASLAGARGWTSSKKTSRPCMYIGIGQATTVTSTAAMRPRALQAYWRHEEASGRHGRRTNGAYTDEDRTAMTDEQTMERTARRYAQTAGAAYGDAAAYLRTLPEAEWHGPTGCARWDVRTLAGHVVGEAVWFPNLTRGVTQQEAPYPPTLYDTLKALPVAALADRLQEAAEALPHEIAAASPAQLAEAVDLGWTTLPLWQATYVALCEAIYHDWDLHVGREPAATIPTPWAQTLATGAARFAPMIADPEGVAAASPGTYLLQVGDGVGPLTLLTENGQLTIEHGGPRTPDVTLWLTADQYVRLVAGRLPLEHALAQGTVSAQGERARVTGLNRIFRGIGGSP